MLSKGTLEFKSPEEATTNSLASKLFTDENVKGVFIGKDFLTVTKSESVEWEILNPPLLSSILDYFSSGVIIENPELEIDLESQEIRRPNGATIKFELDSFRKKCLMEGLDDIGITL